MPKRDANLDHPAVKSYREVFHLWPNWFQRGEIVTTFDWAKKELKRAVSPTVGISDEQLTARALIHWNVVLKQFALEGAPPKRVDWIMDRFQQRIERTS
jgi:hypothetical protein